MIRRDSAMRSQHSRPGQLITVCLLALTFGVGAVRADVVGRIQPYSRYPFYWQYKGEPVLLLGGS